MRDTHQKLKEGWGLGTGICGWQNLAKKPPVGEGRAEHDSEQ